MKLAIKGTNLELTQSLTSYIERKIGGLVKLTRRFEKGGEVKVRVEIGRTTRHHHKGEVFRAEANVLLPGKMFRAEEKNIELHVAIDAVRDKLARDIQNYKERLTARRRRNS